MHKSFVSFLLATLFTAGSLLAYNPPIGIPDPAASFEGFNPVDAPKPNRQQHAPAWFLSTPRDNAIVNGDARDAYYIDNAAANATDTGNPYGHPNRPRLTIPSVVFSAGSYIEVHGDGGTGTQRYSTPLRPRGVGTASAPIWFVGVDQPLFTTTCDIGYANTPETGFLIFDGIHWAEGGRLEIRPRYAGNQIHHLVFRNCVFRGRASTLDSTGIALGSAAVSQNFPTSEIVFHNCDVSDYGDKNAPGEECGVYPRYFVTNLWFLDGRVHDMAEDGFGGSHGGERTSTGYYIGRNKIYRNLTDPIDIKGMGVVVVSENTIYDHQDIWVDGVHKSSGSGAGVTFHYSGDSTGPGLWNNFPEDCSLLFNTIIGGRAALGTSSTGKLRVIGNVIRGTRHKPSGFTDTPSAIDLRGIRGDTWIVNNTVYDCEGGLRIWDSSSPFDATSTYYRSYRATYENRIYVCIADNDGAGIVGVAPTNTTNWREFRVHIQGNVFSHRANQSFPDVRFDNATFAQNSVDMDHNLIHHPLWGGAYQYGSSGLVGLAWMKSNTRQQANGLDGDPQFVDLNAGDMRLAATSPAIDHAEAWLGVDAYTAYQLQFGIGIKVDRAGQIRPTNGFWDLGAFEHTNLGTTTPPPQPTPTVPNAPTNLRITQQ